jgi:exportin-1
LKYLTNALFTTFPNLNKVQVETFVLSMFNKCYKWEDFKTTVRDFLIEIKQFAHDDDALYVEERQVYLIQIFIDLYFRKN